MTRILYLITLIFYLLEENLIISEETETSTESKISKFISDITSCIVAEEICPNEHIKFFLYNRDISESNNFYEINATNETSIKQAPLKKNAELIVLFHGYTGDKDYSPNMELRPAFLTKGDYNIISVDWSALARSPCYVQAAINTDIVGHCTAKLLNSLFTMRPESVSCERTHVIGFSLGAHCAGDTGKYLIEMGCKLPWITGLDPALPLFGKIEINQKGKMERKKIEFLHIIQGKEKWKNLFSNPEMDIFNEKARPEFILEKSDAEFVDIIHTNVGEKGQYGAHGHVDFYINNGTEQPGCSKNSSCDHVRAVEIYAKSILGELSYKGISCDLEITGVLLGVNNEVCRPINSVSRHVTSQVSVGINVSKEARGTYQIITSDAPDN